MEIDIEALERSALAATPGPWLSDGRTAIAVPGAGGLCLLGRCSDNPRGEADVDFAAAANPAVVLELLALARTLHQVAHVLGLSPGADVTEEVLPALSKRLGIDPIPDCPSRQAADSKSAELNQTPPDQTALYRHYDSAGSLLYVGISVNALVRLSQHKNKSPWARLISTITIENFDTRQQAQDAEKLAIQVERPIANIVHGRDHRKMNLRMVRRRAAV